MSEKEIKVLLEAAQVARMDPSNLKPINPFSQNGTTAQTLQMAVQQVDPIGPALFAIAIQEAIEAAKCKVELTYPGEVDFTVFYLNDGVAAGIMSAGKLLIRTRKRA